MVDHPKLNEISNHAFIFYHFKENSFNDKDFTIVSAALDYVNEPNNRELEDFLKFLEGKTSFKRKEFLERKSILFQVILGGILYSVTLNMHFC